VRNPELLQGDIYEDILIDSKEPSLSPMKETEPDLRKVERRSVCTDSLPLSTHKSPSQLATHLKVNIKKRLRIYLQQIN
jgi:hypothetical protein